MNKKDNDIERRVRQRGTEEKGYSFYYTEKINVSDGVRIEKEERISKDTYIAYLADSDTALHQISKTRYCFLHNNQYFEMDIYPFSNEYAILEVEVNDINEKVELPSLGITRTGYVLCFFISSVEGGRYDFLCLI